MLAKKPLLRIIRPSSREQGELLKPRVEALRQAGFDVLYDDLPADPTWLYSAASAQERAQALADALLESGTTAVLCARGGYGASDLLPLLPWDALRAASPKLLVGFSDVSALHTAFYARLGWRALHAPMPATALWEQDGHTDDVGQLLDALRSHARGEPITGELPLTPVGVAAESMGTIDGPLFGGCFTVITNLIGTPYMPGSLADHVIFIEDTDEHPARLMRAFNQWRQSGVLDGARALVIGYLRRLGDKIPDCAPFVYEEFARRCSLPVFRTEAFGHVSPNAAVAIGGEASLTKSRLRWRLDPAAAPSKSIASAPTQNQTTTRTSV